ncbi:GerAB/ArcD/ProY family transporter [Paenibacillus chondroitinus]|uniref:GerAB/ArcD/ProY family transporter n=1 Tax=Paenibacillus chondroitinus TaxID=59842 RepID=A0ABU6DFB1_9BACL|nr:MULTISPECIES: GerAB/ArcD/ProY family transporter [Paenibacillus]MCY9659320.1 spore germination protein [Paenibacillus anseongense]MEB4796344.1 GerAB/ArcD/ProY family transporter [Paenibacillus chondroitinus]
MTSRLQIGLVFIIIHMGFGYLQYPSLIYKLTKTGHWGVVLSYGLLLLSLMMICKKGLDYFPEKDLIDVYLKMGRWVAFLFLIPYALNITALVAMSFRHHAEVIASIFLIRTPIWAIILLLLVISTYTAIKGLETILRSSVIIFLIVNILVAFVIITSFVNFDFRNALPIRPPSLHFATNINFLYLMGFSSLFLGFIPSKTNLTYRQLFGALAYVICFYLAVVYISLFIFGTETVDSIFFPAKEAADSVDMNWFVFNQQTMFFGLSMVGFTIILNGVMLWMILQIIQKLFNLQSKKASYWICAFSLTAFLFAISVPNLALIEKCALWSAGANAVLMVIIPFTILIYGVLAGKGRLAYEKK